MSGYANFDDAVRALRMGGVDFFTKPVAIGAVRQCIDSYAGRQQREQLAVINAPKGPVAVVGEDDHGWNEQPVTVGTMSWSSPDEARDAFAEVSDEVEIEEVRQVLAELLQAAPHGKLVVNRAQSWWTAWLDADVEWSSPAQQDRQSF